MTLKRKRRRKSGEKRPPPENKHWRPQPQLRAVWQLSLKLDQAEYPVWAGMWLRHRGSPVSGMSPICATFHRSCQSCKITRTAEPARPARPAEAPRVANPAPRSGRRKASLRDQKPGSEKKRGSGLAKKPAMSQPAFRMGLPRYRPQAAPRLAAAFRAFLTSARTCQSQSRGRRKALVCRCRRSPRPGPRTLPRARFANRGGPALFYIWAENPGNDFGGLSVAKSSKNQ